MTPFPIECCYKSADGSFTKETYDSLIHLLAYLVKKYGLSTDDILRHYDCGGKNVRFIMWNMRTIGSS